MVLVATGRNYKIGRQEVSVFGHSRPLVDSRDDVLIEFQEMIKIVVGQIAADYDKPVLFRVNISPKFASWMLSFRGVKCRRHFTMALEGEDYIEIKNYLEVDGHAVDLCVLKDMGDDIELVHGSNVMKLETYGTVGVY